jgi:hypothetical protein
MILKNRINNSNFPIKVNKKEDKNFQEILYLLNLQINKLNDDKYMIKIIFNMMTEKEWSKLFIKKTKIH